MGVAYVNAFSDGYLVGELNEIPCQKMGDKGHHGPGDPGKRLTGLDDGPIIFCAVPAIFCAYFVCGVHLASEIFLLHIHFLQSNLITQLPFG